MNRINQNIGDKTFIKIIEELNSWNYSEAGIDDIIAVGLNLFKNFPEFHSASLFMMDQSDYDFHFKASSSENSTSISKIFNEAVDDGVIAEILATERILVGKPSKYLPENTIDLFLPLVSANHVVGIILLIVDDELTDHQSFFILSEMFTRTLSLIIANKQQQIEMIKLRENSDLIISKKLSDAVKDSKTLGAILNSLNIGVMVVERKSKKVTDINLYGASFIGGSKKSIIGTKSTDYFYFADNSADSFKEVITNDALLKTNDGKLVAVMRNVATLIIGGNTYDIESFIDISDRKKMEDALQLSKFEMEHNIEKRTEELTLAYQNLEGEIREREKAEKDLLKIYWAVHNSPVSVVITDKNGVIEYVNPKFSSMTGYKFEEVIGQNPNIQKSGDMNSFQYRTLWETIQSGREWRNEFRNKKKNGELYWVSASISPIMNDEGEISHFVGIQEDITRSKNDFADLIIAKQKVEESDRLKTSIISNLSHELRTPLIAILGYTQFLMSEIEDETNLEMILDINSAGNRLLKTLNDLLYLSQLESISIELNLTNSNLVTIAENIYKSRRKGAKDKNIEFTFKYESANMWSSVDEELIKHSIDNIVENAIKFTLKGKIDFVLRSVKIDNRIWNIIDCKDTGVGIKPDNLQKIFESFRQLSEGYSRNFEGCGLGLTIAQKIIEIHHGQLIVHSDPGIGSTFSIWLPAEK